MEKSRFTDEQIVFALKPAVRVEEVCRKVGVSQQTMYHWRKKFGDLGVFRSFSIRGLLKGEASANGRSKLLVMTPATFEGNALR